MHHPKTDVDRLYLPGTTRGRGMVQMELAFKTTTIGLDTNLTTTDDPLLQIVKHHGDRKKMHSIRKEASKFGRQLYLSDMPKITNELTTKCTGTHRFKQKVKHKGQQQL